MPAFLEWVTDPVIPGVAWMVVVLALSTVASEDLACLTAGALVVRGDIGFLAATMACFAGIVASDAALFLAGRVLGPTLLARWPFTRLAETGAFDRCRAWVARRGAGVIIASRFMPGTRVATHVAAGVLGLRTGEALRAIVLGSAAWTPLIVWSGMHAAAWGRASGLPLTLPALVTFAIGILVALHGLRAAATHEGRRRLVGVWRRTTRWEFWPPWVFYVPVVAWIAWLMLRHRHPTLFTAANPVIPGGGFAGESKTDILRQLARGGAPVAPFIAIEAASDPLARAVCARSFLGRQGLPVVLKPDVGQRGTGVRILRSEAEVVRAVDRLEADAILQAHVSGLEFGLFYARHPALPRGRILSITEKRIPAVTGDGRRTLRRLILDDPRAVAMARVYEGLNRDRLDEVPPAGERVTIGRLGSHCRGAVFLDGARHRTSELEEAVERASRGWPGFSFGRYDVRAETLEDLRAGRFTILELNGVTSEPTHIYDPAHGLLSAWRTVARAWTLAFEIGRAHAERGARVWSLWELVALARGRAIVTTAETSEPAASSNPANRTNCHGPGPRVRPVGASSERA